LEGEGKWIDLTKKAVPSIEAKHIRFPTRVSDSLPAREAYVESFPPPPEMYSAEWDIILIDAPAGFDSDSPGRSLPIYWASKVSKPTTHIFVDDASRSVERAYAQMFLDPIYGPPMHLTGNRTGERLMFWYRALCPKFL
jgi:glucuronoxylan 4-O-methyltransferase